MENGKNKTERDSAEMDSANALAPECAQGWQRRAPYGQVRTQTWAHAKARGREGGASDGQIG